MAHFYSADHAVENFVLTVTNCGNLHDDFVKLAKSGSGFFTYLSHIKDEPRQEWRKAMHDMKLNLTQAQWKECAKLLQGYYFDYINEL